MKITLDRGTLISERRYPSDENKRGYRWGGRYEKKSHISLAWYLMNSEGMDALKLHKGSFYMGSVLPDCMPSFLVRRHTIEDSFEVLEKEFQKLVSHFDPKKGINCYFC